VSVVQVLAKPAVQAVLAARVLLAGHLQALLLAGLAASAPGSAVLLETDLPQPHLQPPPRVLLQAGLCLGRALPPGAGAPRTGALRPLGTPSMADSLSPSMADAVSPSMADALSSSMADALPSVGSDAASVDTTGFS